MWRDSKGDGQKNMKDGVEVESTQSSALRCGQIAREVSVTKFFLIVNVLSKEVKKLKKC